jgi:hypothetical protein
LTFSASSCISLKSLEEVREGNLRMGKIVRRGNEHTKR